jgi:hypothetical protein
VSTPKWYLARKTEYKHGLIRVVDATGTKKDEYHYALFVNPPRSNSCHIEIRPAKRDMRAAGIRRQIHLSGKVFQCQLS